MNRRSFSRLVAIATALLAGSVLPAAAQQQNTVSFNVNGINVILSPADNQLISVIVGLEGGLASGETSNPALGEFTTDLITSSGSTKFSKNALREFTSRTSTSMHGEGDYRGINFQMTTPLPSFDRAWDMFASMVVDPLYDEVEYRTIMGQRVARAKRRWSSPEGYASIIADSLLRLENPVLGRTTQQSDIEAVSIPMMREFKMKLTERSRMLIVVVGNISQNDLKKKLESFSSLPMGSYKPVKISSIDPPSAPRVQIVEFNTPTTYIKGTFAGPRAGDPDYWPLQIGLRHLDNVLFEEVRTKRNLSYAPGSGLGSTLGSSYGIVSVSTTRPDSTIGVMLAELTKMTRGEFDAADLEASKQVFITGYYMRQMTNRGVATALYSSQRNVGNWKAANSLDAINKVNKQSVQRVMQKYARNLQVGIVGRKEGITESRYLYGQRP